MKKFYGKSELWDYLINLRKKYTEINEMGNRVLQENLANAAIGMLKEGEDYNELAYTKGEFGYLFDVKGRAVEGLFKKGKKLWNAYKNKWNLYRK